ncbi:MAG: L-2-hydroxyglutarate oxidase [Candidatus Brocadia sp. AMX2]|uniref:FAD dependent oxidoreductase n=1 Tax=Candidatus Brocadia sinica JPN1 TaxID=1197129 RepID=A0ABQ0JTC1_9BACT|nr:MULTISPECIES: L-2-hydroxyglutarate oxidase [Brocadia]MBC6931881.1 L-2-hydroxyglutarate oxidase [Candidatus Brocadia sp.]MBL1168354.1 L-2-hydroxyglutarate oxidase [Candidatus Brocadia sp. AMX1]NOG43517.1 L-2-hydroxyglutarate oxidase [Planctomycetota bacterium]GIK12757.1 MAG: aminobutyraldehyde dehydrogenase [Candidatus Brocadia sinica]KAA0243391.1 MAG: L-2-hydroxyglutarate oxidase [Candidatus Brocadia sp. AMX2]
MITTDILIVGGGIVGVSLAKEITSRYPDINITLIEKEASLARHASGRNSGVLHAGFYYTPDSLKARFTVEGNRLLTDYCMKNHLTINRCGKIVVAKDEAELEGIFELKRRGDKNGVELEIVDEERLPELEPNARTFDKALYSPTTSVVNPTEVVEHIAQNLKGNVKILLNEKFMKRDDVSTVCTNTQKIKFGHFINSAGLYADKIAHQFGIGQKYILIPFKGLYLEYKDTSLIRKHIYPVPNLKNPFLGVHFTITAAGKIKIGPTAIPAFWRENYQGISNFSLNEFFEVLFHETKLFVTNAFHFRSLAFEEMKKYCRNHFIQQSVHLVKKIDTNKFGNYLNPGIRAQLLDTETLKLVMDFVVEHGENSTHILNAVSPAFTSAFSFSKFIVDEVEKRMGLSTKL